ncbi:gfo/Idh/MocA family oxidoreductase [Pseudoprevotella muciniphila]|uniref:Gfo/Idh/MocA family oxidoreductase n=1 Tax=Pseudoprevotella muciniphila TaxID=2133944 RepID=A0A5P8E979_9BACT|nr:Gfo/Idh/MocA family oxidoreductase [Pseudoprevotella muciniphila]QFQ13595.1 gfo/Idh/MocA family oxidoreductase [Pseudoprevotella muciniphila]
MLEFRTEPIKNIRIALIGLGQRGMKTLERYAYIRGAEIRYVADLDEERLDIANAVLAASGRPQARKMVGEEAWREVCRQDDVDLVYICTEWRTHTPMAVEAMTCGKHVAVEVPIATTIEECWQIVDTAERTRRHCFMTENCCYDNFALATLEMSREGLFGELTHVEGAYIHDLRDTLGLSASAAAKQQVWMEVSFARHGGNAYPTHGMGPIGWLINLHRGNRMTHLVSMTSNGAGTDRMLGKVNSTLIHTAAGITILQQLDVTTPRPYSRLQTICGSEGYAQKYPLPTLRLADSDKLLTGEDALNKADGFMQKNPASGYWNEGRSIGVPNEMNYAMDCRLVHCLHYGLPLDIDVYDAAEWSAIAPLSKLSAEKGGMPVEVPDFTRGRWDVLTSHRFYQ